MKKSLIIEDRKEILDRLKNIAIDNTKKILYPNTLINILKDPKRKNDPDSSRFKS